MSEGNAPVANEGINSYTRSLEVSDPQPLDGAAVTRSEQPLFSQVRFEVPELDTASKAVALGLMYGSAESDLMLKVILHEGHPSQVALTQDRFNQANAAKATDPESLIQVQNQTCVLQQLINNSGLLKGAFQEAQIGSGLTPAEFRALQNALVPNASNGERSWIKVDCDFGPATRIASYKCQLEMGSQASKDGDAGPKTFAGLAVECLESGTLTFADPDLEAKWRSAIPLLEVLKYPSYNQEILRAKLEHEEGYAARDARIAAAKEMLGLPEGASRKELDQKLQEVSGDGIAGRGTVIKMLRDHFAS